MNELLELYNTMAVSVKQHSERVAACAVMMAKYAMPDLQAEYNLSTEELTEAVYVGCLYHDIGKLFLPPMVLICNSTEAEKNRIATLRSHTKDGHKQIKKYGKSCFGKDKRYVQVVADIALYHHECYNGSDSPHGLSEDAIPSAAGLCALANKLDHLYETFVIKCGDDFELIANLIEAQSGRCYAPELVDWFTSAKDELAAFYATQNIHLQPSRELQHA